MSIFVLPQTFCVEFEKKMNSECTEIECRVATIETRTVGIAEVA
jgi:hypothetical protein